MFRWRFPISHEGPGKRDSAVGSLAQGDKPNGSHLKMKRDVYKRPAEDCEKIDFIFVTPQVLVKNCEMCIRDRYWMEA